MKLFTAAEAAFAIGCNESTIRRQAARAWDTNGGPGPLAKHPRWQVVRRSAPEGGQGCGWMLARSEQFQSFSPAAQAVLDATRVRFYERPPTGAELAAWIFPH